MCYTIQQLEERILKQGQRKQSTPDEILESLRIFREQIKGKPLFAVSGFEHPELPVLVSNATLHSSNHLPVNDERTYVGAFGFAYKFLHDNASL